VNESNVIGKSVDTLPVHWLGAVIANDVCCITKDIDLFVVCGTDHLVTCGTETNRWDTSVRLCGYGAVAESTVEAETFHRRAVSGDVIELFERSVDGVREVDRLIVSLFKSKNWNRLTNPSCDYECCDSTNYRNYSETTNSKYRHQHPW